MKPHVWIADGESAVCDSLRCALQRDYHIRAFERIRDAAAQLEQDVCDLVLLGFGPEGEDSLKFLRRIKKRDPGLPVIAMIDRDSDIPSLTVMNSGASTYLTRPPNIDELRIFIIQALTLRRMSEEVAFLSGELRDRRVSTELIGASEAMERVRSLIGGLADTDAAVLITGESCSGKALCARVLHESSNRKNERFVAVNCAAVPAYLLEAELFGCRRSAHTGAPQGHKGKFELADRGTIFLEDIGDAPANLQDKLLRVLKSGEFTPIGASGICHVDTRVIASTSRDLGELTAANSFHRDLYLHLNHTSIHMPALRERLEDIPALCVHFLRRFTATLHKSICGLTEEAIEMLCGYVYPGNVRQLSDFLECAAIVNTTGVLGVEDFPQDLRFLGSWEESAYIDRYLSSASLRDVERRSIEATLYKNNGKRDQTARDLGISRRGLLNKIKAHSLEFPRE